jgi:hypothetical protein
MSNTTSSEDPITSPGIKAGDESKGDPGDEFLKGSINKDAIDAVFGKNQSGGVKPTTSSSSSSLSDSERDRDAVGSNLTGILGTKDPDSASVMTATARGVRQLMIDTIGNTALSRQLISQVDQLEARGQLTDQALTKLITDNIGINNTSQLLIDKGKELFDDAKRTGRMVDATFDGLNILRQEVGAFREDMFGGQKAMMDAFTMLTGGSRGSGGGGGNLEQKVSSEPQTPFAEFVSLAMSGGLSESLASELANKMDLNQDGSVSATEFKRYNLTQNTVANRALRDPAFRSLLVPKAPYSSIYGDDPLARFDQTALVNQSLALSAEDANLGNVAFAQ